MNYNFDEVLDRRNTASLKWDSGTPDMLPMWVADMDFPVSQAIVTALEKRVQHPVYAYSIQDDG